MNANELKSEVTAKTVEDVKLQVEEILSRRGYSVVDSKEEAEECFKDMEMEGHLFSETTATFEVEGEEDHNYIPTIKVDVIGYYKDSGSVDYFFEVRVDEY